MIFLARRTDIASGAALGVTTGLGIVVVADLLALVERTRSAVSICSTTTVIGPRGTVRSGWGVPSRAKGGVMRSAVAYRANSGRPAGKDIVIDNFVSHRPV